VTRRVAVYDAPPALLRGLAWGAAASGAVFLAGLFLAPERVWAGYLVGFHLLTGLALAGPLFLALLYVSGARWAAALGAVPRAMAAALPAAAAAGLVLLFGVHSLFEWSHAEVVAADPVLQAKRPWLDTPFLAVRTAVCFAVWLWLGRRIVRLAPDAPRAVRLRRGALFVAAFGVTYSVLSFDWAMSLEPHWFSTVYALLTAAGLVLSGLAAATLLAVVVRRATPDSGTVTDEHLHDLGNLLFGFSLFWAYIGYSQYMLVWYTNMPEETAWYAAREHGVWGTLLRVNLVLNFGVPFVALLWRRARRSARVLLRVAVVLLVGRVVDLFVLLGPPLFGPEPRVGLWELAPVLGALALFAFLVLRALSVRPLVQPADPALPYSLSYHS
jgi:hypothetical protein